MFVTDNMIAEMAAKYGTPQEREFHFGVARKELDRIRSSQKQGRNHDVTLYIQKDDRLVVIAKHMYPPNLYRAPSGGLQPGEQFEEGIAREVTEETGCRIELERFLLRTFAWFKYRHDAIFWRSFVFLARYAGGDFKFTDHSEIREVRLAAWSEFDSFGHIMRTMDIGGLDYRAALHEAVVELLAPGGPSGDNRSPVK